VGRLYKAWFIIFLTISRAQIGVGVGPCVVAVQVEQTVVVVSTISTPIHKAQPYITYVILIKVDTKGECPLWNLPK